MQRVSFERVALCCSVLLQHTTTQWNDTPSVIGNICKDCRLSVLHCVAVSCGNTLQMQQANDATPIKQAFERMTGTAISEILKSRNSEKSTCYSIHYCIWSVVCLECRLSSEWQALPSMKFSKVEIPKSLLATPWSVECITQFTWVTRRLFRISDLWEFHRWQCLPFARKPAL